MISPFVILNSSSCSIERRSAPQTGAFNMARLESNYTPQAQQAAGLSASRPLKREAGSSLRRIDLVPREHVIDLEEILRIPRGLLYGLTDEGGSHQLMIAVAVIDLVGLQLNLRRQLEIAERSGELDAVECLFVVGNKRVGLHRGVTEPGARRWHLAVATFADVGNKFLDMRHARLFPIPFEHPIADARLGRHAFERLELLLQSGDVNLLVDAELGDLLQTVHHARALHQNK